MYINQQLSPFSPTSFGTQGMMGLGMQMMLLNQMMKLMMTVFALVAGESGQAAFSGGSPAFGTGGGFGSGGSPLSSFLGSGGAGVSGGTGSAASSAPIGDAKSVGGGFVSPVDNYRISSRFGPRKAPTAGASTYHKGIDLAAPLNTPVRAAKAGKVTVSKDQATGYGKWIEIQHADGTKTRYGHLNSRDVQVGSQVQAGQVIGKMGSTGTSTGSHLHFEVLDKSGRQVNPEQVMKL